MTRDRVDSLRLKIKSIRSEQNLVLNALAALTGAVSGAVAVVFRLAVYWLSVAFSIIPDYIGIIGWIIVPVIGSLFSGFLTTRFAPEASGHGVPEVMESYVLEGGKIRPRVPIIKTIASAFTIGSGGSCGREGPIAQIGSGTGSSLAQLFKLGRRDTRTLVVCGLASGIASIFTAPLGGALFGLEVLVGELSGVSVIPVILASVIGVAIVNGFFGPDASSLSAPSLTLTSYSELIFYFIMGLMFGVISKVWVKILYVFEEFFTHLRTSDYFKPALGGLGIGLLGAWVVVLEWNFKYSGIFTTNSAYVPAVMGSGYAFINAALIGSVPFLALITFGFLKMFATAFSIGSGGSGGVFAPTLFMGAGIGGAFGIIFNMIAPDIALHPMAYALVGMAAMFAGAAHVPVTCIVMTMEMTGDYNLILPLMIAVASSYMLAVTIMPESIYTEKLRMRGINLKRGLYIDALRSITVKQIMTREPVVLSPDMTADDALRVLNKTHHTKFPVVDSDGNLVGTVIAEDLEKRYDSEGNPLKVRNLMMQKFLTVNLDTTMDEVLHAMMKQLEGHAVVLDPSNPHKMLGFITKTDVFRAYESAIASLRLEGSIEECIPVFTDKV
ncbi:MAG: chloride channel protein [Candidatus Thorarchaeota archaeon]|nr:chloride channel protein [Candidatus Thorarchaeota archaeon]